MTESEFPQKMTVYFLSDGSNCCAVEVTEAEKQAWKMPKWTK